MTGLQKLKIFDEKRHNPAVGYSYGRTPLGRFLVVGMSHYGDECDVRWPGFTHMIVSEVIEGKRKISYFTKIASLFTDDDGEPYTPAKFYSAIAFYNFLPDVFEKREKVDDSQWLNSDAQRFFFRVVDALKPERVLVTGEKLWRTLPSKDLDDSGMSRDSGDLTGPDVLFGGDDRQCCWYRVKGADCCLVGAISHPSTAKFNRNRNEIVEWVRKFMACKKGVPAHGAV
jgi:hypothetical protein